MNGQEEECMVKRRNVWSRGGMYDPGLYEMVLVWTRLESFWPSYVQEEESQGRKGKESSWKELLKAFFWS
jgi:hypothetical protein